MPTASALEISSNPAIRNQDIHIKNQTIPLLSPTNLTAESTEIGMIVLHWTDNSAGESGFTIERKQSSDDTYFPIDNVAANVSTYEQTELSTYAVFPGEDYYYRVKAYNSNGSSGYSNEAYIMVKANIPSPSAPAALRAKGMMVNGRLTVRLFWGDTANNEDKYVVQRSKTGGGYVVAGELPANSYKFEEPADLERNVKYTYRVIAYNGGGAGLSNTTDVTLPASLPSTPIFSVTQQSGSSKLHLSWSDNSNNEDGFRLTRWGDNPMNLFTGETPPDKEYVLDPNTTSLEITELTPFREYSFRIVAYNALGESIPATISYITGPYAPESLSVSAVSPTEIKVAWVKSIYGTINGFSIERKKSGSAYAEIATVEADVLSYSDPLLAPGTLYFYRARTWYQGSYGKYYWSDYSNEMGMTTPGQNTTNLQNNQGELNNGLKVIKFTLGQNNYQVNGQTLPIETAPVSLEGRTMLPVKYLTDPLKANLAWAGGEQKVTITLDGKVIELFIGKNTALVNGQTVLIDPQNPSVVPIVSAEGRTLMPIGFISQNLGCQVEWNSQTQTASLSYAEK